MTDRFKQLMQQVPATGKLHGVYIVVETVAAAINRRRKWWCWRDLYRESLYRAADPWCDPWWHNSLSGVAGDCR